MDGCRFPVAVAFARPPLRGGARQFFLRRSAKVAITHSGMVLTSAVLVGLLLLMRSNSRPKDSLYVVITGASSGIGQACALALDRRGFGVFAGVRTDADAQRLCSIASSRLQVVRLDVTEPDTIHSAAESIRCAVGEAGLAGLVNNAGIVVTGPVELVPLELWRRQLEVNVIGQVAVIQALIGLVRQGRGRIVNVSSISGILAAPLMGPYAASKHALEAISDSLRVELRPWGIEVCVVEPGNVKTPIWEKSRAAAEELAKRMPPETEALYGRQIAAMRKATARMAQSGMPVQRVVEAVLHALTARRPKARYRVGTQTRLAAIFWRLLGESLQDWIMCRELRWPREGLRQRP